MRRAFQNFERKTTVQKNNIYIIGWKEKTTLSYLSEKWTWVNRRMSFLCKMNNTRSLRNVRVLIRFRKVFRVISTVDLVFLAFVFAIWPDDFSFRLSDEKSIVSNLNNVNVLLFN